MKRQMHDCKTFLSGSARALSAALIVLGSFSAQAQTGSFSKTVKEREKSSQVSVTVEPLWLAVKGIGGKVDYFVTDKVSVGIGGIYIPNHAVEKSEDDKQAGSLKSPDYNWEHQELLISSMIMLTGSLSSDGFYVNPGVGYQKTAITNYSTFDYSGSLESPMGRLTAGYQWITSSNFRFGLGAGATLIPSSEIVIADNAGKTVHTEKSSSLGGLALDLHVGYVF